MFKALPSLTILLFAAEALKVFSFPVALKLTKSIKVGTAFSNHDQFRFALDMTTGLDEDPQMKENHAQEESSGTPEKMKGFFPRPPKNEFQARMDVSNVFLFVALVGVLTKWSMNLGGYSYEWLRQEGTPIPKFHVFSLDDARINRQFMLEDRRYQYEKDLIKKQQEQKKQQSRFFITETDTTEE